MKLPNIGKVLAVLLLGTIILVGCGGNKKSEAESRMKNLGLLLVITVSDSKEIKYPDMSSPEVVKAALQPALAKEKTNDGRENWDDSIFIHPSSGQPFTPNPSLSNLGMDKIDMPANVIAFYAPEPDGDERLVGYSDGHTEWVKESDWTIKKMSGYVK